jgi:ABC-type sugar transport system ATPase subunit
MKAVLQLQDVVKTFPGVVALQGVSLDLMPGEVCGLVGENGAGKSTLVKIISGIYKPDSGSMDISGTSVSINNSISAGEHGIQVMHQDRKNAPNLTVAENLFLTQMPLRFGMVDKKTMEENAKLLLAQVGLENLNPQVKIGSLSIAVQQMIDLARILITDPKIVLFDEPTAALSKKDVEHLFRIIRELTSRGVAVIYISHYLDEVLDISNRVYILRDGNHVGTFPAAELTAEQVIAHMIGDKRTVLRDTARKVNRSSEIVLEVNNLSVQPKIHQLSFHLIRGEILGLYGTVGAGKTECLKSIYGLDMAHEGEIIIRGKHSRSHNVQRSLKEGIVLVPEDRKRQGLVLKASVRMNATLGIEFLFEKFMFLRKKKEKSLVEEYVRKLSVKTPDIETEVGNLSGGNQQKVVLSRGLARGASIFLLDEPTVGIDVGARAEIYRLIREIADKGTAVIVASSEISEIMEISDRILVMRQGEITAELNREEASEDKLLFYAIGGK